jgi:hypothetical protein
MAAVNRLEWGVSKAMTLPVLCVLLVAGCGGGGGPSTIGPSGGIVNSNDDRASVNIPAGALPQDTVIRVVGTANPPGGNIGTAYDFRPGGVTFAEPVTISITYDEATLPEGVQESGLRLGTVTNSWEQFQFTEPWWTAVGDTTVDTAANVVSRTTMHFSIYGVIAVDGSAGGFGAPTGVSVGLQRITLERSQLNQ